VLGLDDDLVSIKDALEKSAMFDPLTNTLTESAFLTLSRGELERSRRGQTHLSLIALKIENFKEFSDKYGRDIANDVLVLIAQVIREKSRPYDNVGRFDEDIFLIPLPGVIGQDAEKIASRIIKGVLSTNISLLDGTAVNVSISTGIVSSSRITAAMEIESWIEKAREAVSRSHRDGEDKIFTIFI
jgi:diguanylate cyclase (GGDEF)-like protein